MEVSGMEVSVNNHILGEPFSLTADRQQYARATWPSRLCGL